jgi:hypothetical protein
MRDHKLDHLAAISKRYPNRAADTNVECGVLGYRYGHDPLLEVRLDQGQSLVVHWWGSERIANEDRRMRPSGLRQILDGAGNALISVNK